MHGHIGANHVAPWEARVSIISLAAVMERKGVCGPPMGYPMCGLTLREVRKGEASQILPM